jgi:hypothetical protein
MGSKELELKIGKLKGKNKALLKEKRASDKRMKYILFSKKTLRQKYKAVKSENKDLRRKNKLLKAGKGERILRHKYNVIAVNLCVSIYLLGGCSFRGVVRIVEYLRLFMGLDIADIPCKSSIENWVQKCGHYIYEHPDLSKYKDGYGLIIDECMVIGQERMLAILGVKANKEDTQALNLCQAEILSLQVKPSWSGEEITESLQKVGEKMGEKADYIVCDGGANLGKGIKGYKGLRVCDCGHEIARQTEQVYKEDKRLTLFSKAAAQTKFKEVMKDTSYLTPPKQRSIARFMNLSTTIEWAKKILGNFNSFNEKEQKAFGCIKEHSSIIEELDRVFDTSNAMLKLLKNNGLSFKTIKECTSICEAFAQKAQGLPAKWIGKIAQYLQKEKAKLPDEETVWHVSSDIIESLFGTFKSRKADNPLYGVTPFTLALPVLTKIDPQKPEINIDFKEALESTFMSDLKQWNSDHLIENQVVKRRMVLKI